MIGRRVAPPSGPTVYPYTVPGNEVAKTLVFVEVKLKAGSLNISNLHKRKEIFQVYKEADRIFSSSIMANVNLILKCLFCIWSVHECRKDIAN